MAQGGNVTMTEEDMIKHLAATGKFKVLDLCSETEKENGSTPNSAKSFGRGRIFENLTSTPKEVKPIFQHFQAPQSANMTESHYMGQYMHNIPKLTTFSGEEPVPRGECSYKEWHYEVKCLQSDPSVSEHTLLQSIRRSLKGPARQIIISLGEKANLHKILHKLSSMFASTSDNNNVMQEFFSAFQKTEKSVTTSACRLEGILTNAHDCTHLSMETRHEMLRCKFWTSLRSDQLKSQTRHKYDTVKEYEQLIKEVRTVEHEMSLNVQSTAAAAGTKKTHQAAISVENDLEKRLKALELKVDGKFDSLEKKFDEMLKFQSHSCDSAFSQQTPRRPYNNNNGRYNNNNSRYNNNNSRYSNNNNGRYNNRRYNNNNNRDNNNYENDPKE